MEADIASKVLGVDPGGSVSGCIIKCEGEILYAAGKLENEAVFDLFDSCDKLVIELFVLHSNVGTTCRDTLLFTGRLWQACKTLKKEDPVFITRTKVTSELGLNTREARKDKRSMDTKVIERMKLIYGVQTEEKHVTYHAWQALGLLEAYDRIQNASRNKTTKKRVRP